MENQISEKKIEIVYRPAKFWHRCIANLIDILLFVLMFFLLFLGIRAIVQTTPSYHNADQKITEIRLESGLYVKDSKGEIRDIITYIGVIDADLSSYGKILYAEDSIDTFLSYVEKVCDSSDAQEIKNSYDESRLNKNLCDDAGNPYFIKDGGGNIIRNEQCNAKLQQYYDNFYVPYIDNTLQGYLVTRVPNYYEYTKYMSNMLVFVELPISYLTSGILVYFIPTLFFKRGRKTLGKAIYHIGLVDKNILSPSFKRNLARFCIFYFGELILSLFTFGIPYIISFSLMAFSKKKQGFPDFMLNLQEIDTSTNNIYFDFDEISINNLKHEHKPVDFKLRDLP